MPRMVFRPQSLPDELARTIAVQLDRAHQQLPFTPLDAREAARRAAEISDSLGLSSTIFRGTLTMAGVDVDHLWLELNGVVVDPAFPLFAAPFVDLLPGYVAGDVSGERLESVARVAGIADRVIGLFPAGSRYVGAPVWSAR